MDADKLNQLKADCGRTLYNSLVKPKSPRGRAMIHAFWAGVMSATGEQPPFVVICLMSGRHEDLVTAFDPAKEAA